MRTIAMIAVLLGTSPLAAQDFSEGSEARSWNLYAEQPARFEARVVDMLCAVTGDCPEDCGGGQRQIGLLRSVDDVLVYPNKNAQPVFSGAAVDLLPFCGADVEVDGLMLDDPDIGARNIYLVQRIRRLDGDEWINAQSWTENWAAQNPDASGEGPWFRRDPRVAAEIEAHGYLGLGLDVDAAFIADWF
ncbi:hypothetical protein [Meridianimarinicoccus aquatilis]|uniref:DUF2147 domain-containing protein n=1 Tax=Meridianimarinicoccus aquatilis TaxID=2552766 RepID=A0A4R6AQS2_9RHOB|nr:hypothetical protein [Fluviibacterium aquatile]QIE40847.1 hypothetical protein G5B39_02010 [Rhodobacteraceae bacterium SC52]TDL85804.1 hypothetical protein E2L05_14765 [Fluviibacterium aquatile]